MSENVEINFFDTFLLQQRGAEDVVNDILESIILSGAKILHTHYLKTQINPYASKTISQELIMNSTWAKLPLGPELGEVEPDEDLELPKIDQWANGALIVSESMPLRSSVAKEHKPPPSTPKRRVNLSPSLQLLEENRNADELQRWGPKKNQQTSSSVLKPKVSSRITTNRFYPTKSARTSRQHSEAAIIQKLFEETKKSTGKNMTMDSDLNIIEISDHTKGLTSALIVPKVSTKKTQKADTTAKTLKAKKRVPIQKREGNAPKKVLPKLIEADFPTFDENAATVPVADKFICVPGVTFKEGSTVKSKPLPNRPNEYTRTQYQNYLEEFKKSAEGDFYE